MTKLFICGDIVNYEHEDGIICSNELANIISEADYSICNFEAPIEGYGEPIPKAGPHHFQRKSTINGLKKQGFNLLCMANNHMMDFGEKGLLATMEEANKVGLDTIGVGKSFSEAYKPLIKTINNIKFGFINGCEAQFGVLDYFSGENQSGYAWINHHKIDHQIMKLKRQCDYVIVLSHAGLEHYNIPQKEWRQRYKHFCDLGADIVVGSHPHVPQGFEKYNDSLIFYSLGNFYFDSKNYINKEDRSYAIIIEFKKNEEISFVPIYHHKENGQVQLSPDEKKINLDLLNSFLTDKYEKLHDSMSLEIFHKYTKTNLIYSLLSYPFDGNIKSSIKKILSSILKKRKKVDKDLLSLHLFRNEAYYYATRHALELISQEKHGWR